jgi:hypothetical protein
LIDGEGCISIDKKFTIRIDVGMSAKAMAALRWLETHYGGSVRLTREATEKWEAAYCWTLIGRKVEDVLRAIRPHMLLKMDQAGIVFDMQALRRSMPTTPGGRMRWTDDGRVAAERLRLLMRDANRKGPQHSPTLAGERIALLVGERWMSLQGDLFDGRGLTSYSETWPRAGYMRNGIAFRRQPLAPLTGGTASGSLPTPTARDHKDTGENTNYEHLERKSRLAGVVEMRRRRELWATPTKSDGMGGPGNSGRDGGENLRTQVGGSLNPEWVCWLMGFPPGWVDIGTESQTSPVSRSECQNGSTSSGLSATHSSPKSPNGLDVRS